MDWIFESVGKAFPYIFIAYGIYLAASGILASMHIRRSSRWPVAKGRIVLSEIKEGFKSIGYNSDFLWIASPKVEYEFMADGNMRKGNMISLVQVNTSSRGDAESKIAKYPIGVEVLIHYNQKKPDESFLEDSNPLTPLALFIPLGSILTLVGLWLLK